MPQWRKLRRLCVCVFSHPALCRPYVAQASDAHVLLQEALNQASTAAPTATSVLELRRRELNVERKRIAKELAREKRKRKRILEKTKALSEAEMAAEIVARRVRASAKARPDA